MFLFFLPPREIPSLDSQPSARNSQADNHTRENGSPPLAKSKTKTTRRHTLSRKPARKRCKAEGSQYGSLRQKQNSDVHGNAWHLDVVNQMLTINATDGKPVQYRTARDRGGGSTID